MNNWISKYLNSFNGKFLGRLFYLLLVQLWGDLLNIHTLSCSFIIEKVSVTK